ncbi:MAG: hypothetical protein ACRCTR_02100 [Actinomycetota bacterium]
MSNPFSASDSSAAGASAPQTLTAVLYSDNPDTRANVRLAVGTRPAADLPEVNWVEIATPQAVVTRVDQGGVDLLILDGEASPLGGLGLCRQLKSEIYHCPPILVMTGRAEDSWLAAWSMANAVVSHPLDPIGVAHAVANLARALND